MNTIFEDLGPALILMLVAAFLGGLIVYFWLRGRYGRLQVRIDQLTGEVADLRNKNKTLEKEHQAATGQVRALENELMPLQSGISEKEAALKAAQKAQGQLEAQVAELSPFQVKYEDLQHRYDTLEESVKELQASMKSKPGAAPKEVPKPAAATADLAEELAREKAVRLTLAEQVEGLRPFRAKFEDLQVKYEELMKEVQELRQEGGGVPSDAGAASFQESIDQLRRELQDAESRAKKAEAEAAQAAQAAAAAPVVTAPAAEAQPEKPRQKETQDEALARIQTRAQEINFDRIGTATAADKDDLKLVKGIGPFIEKKLNSIGIYTFRQIAAFTPEDEDKVNEVIEFFPGRIRRDGWSKQAQTLHQEKAE